MKKTAIVLFGAATAASHAAIIIPSLAGSSNLNSFDVAVPAKLTDGSGLSQAVPGGATLATALATTHVFDGAYQQSWVTNAAAPDYFAASAAPTFIWDLGADVPVSNIVLWQYQNNGGNGTNIGNQAQNLTVRLNTAAQGSVTFSGAATNLTMLNNLQTGSPSPAQSFALGGTTARYVQLTVTDNYYLAGGTTGGGDRVGLGEIRFNTEPVPEPAALGLLALGAVAVRRRRR